MGQKKLRREKFLTAHPVCCFCGGSTPATTEDHVPARTIFDKREWPEGYSFPACKRCNDATRFEEDVVAFLARMRPSRNEKTTEVQRAEMLRCIAAIKNNYPEAHQSLKPSASRVRQFFRETGFQRPPGVLLGDIPLFTFDNPVFRGALKAFGLKLFCALHYFHTGDIVKPHWKVATRLLSNVQIEQGVLSGEVLNVMTGVATIERSRNDLQDQFAYFYTVPVERTSSAYLCAFRESFALLGLVSADPLPKEFDEDIDRGLFLDSPLNHQGT